MNIHNSLRLLLLSTLVASAGMTIVQSASAGCTTCVFYPTYAWCTGGSVAELCTGGTDGCTFAGSFDCGGGCFLPGTLVMTAGGLRPIESLSIGDHVLTMSADGEQTWTMVQHTYKALRTGFYRINDELSVTGDHPFLVDGEWKKVKDLSVGDSLTDASGEVISIISLEHVDAGVRVFNIDVMAPDAFFAGGFLVHNKEFDETD